MIIPTLDLHTHAVASGHGYSTIQEMAAAAKEKGIRILGITEHGPSIEGTCVWLYFKNLFVVPKVIDGVRMLFGAEINILDTKGTLDMTEEQMGRLDLRIAGIHSQCWKGGSKAENTEAVINVMSNPMIDIISHPADGTADLDFEALVRASKRYGTHLEINNHSLHPVRHKTEAVANNLELLRQAKRHDVPVILGSDAHVSFQIADYCFLEALLKEADFPEELILNDKPELILPKHNYDFSDCMN